MSEQLRGGHPFQHGLTYEQFSARATTILKNLALERKGWRRWVFGRWYINDEPLRNDAANLLRASLWHGTTPMNTQFVGDAALPPEGDAGKEGG